MFGKPSEWGGCKTCGIELADEKEAIAYIAAGAALAYRKDRNDLVEHFLDHIGDLIDEHKSLQTWFNDKTDQKRTHFANCADCRSKAIDVNFRFGFYPKEVH